MNRIVVMHPHDPEAWVEQLRAALPRHTVVADMAGTADGVYAIVDRPMPGALARMPVLKAVFSVNAGIEALLESREVPQGIPIVRMADDGMAEGMLEWVLATTLAWHRNLFAYRTSQQTRQWSPGAERLARDRRVTVLGAGHLGGRAAAFLAQIGFQTRVWSRSPKSLPGVTSFVGHEALDAAVAGSEFLINLLPLTAATENLIDRRLLSLLAPGAVLINAGRGRHVVDAAVIEMLEKGQLRAAILDVFREEPLPNDHPFWRHPGVYVTPHVAAITHMATAVASVARNITEFESGRPLHPVVDLKRGY